MSSSALALPVVAPLPWAPQSCPDLPWWRAGQMAALHEPTEPSGWPALDAELPAGGWPATGLTELLMPAAAGELALLAPWLSGLQRRPHGPRELLWVTPPAWPCVAALQALGLQAQALVCIVPAAGTRQAANAAWAAEQALRAGSCAAVLWWTGDQPTAGTTLRRLQLAAQAGGTPLIALRPPQARASSSPAPLRLACEPRPGRRLAVEVFKRRGPPMAGPLLLQLPWPALVTRRAMTPFPVLTTLAARLRDAVDRPAPAPTPAASPALVARRA